MSDPTATTIRAALRDRLLSIRVANGYRTTVAAVRWGREALVSGDTRDQFPLINLFSQYEQPAGDAIGNVLQLQQELSRAVQLEATLLAGDTEVDFEDQFDALLEDLRRALSQPAAPAATAPLNSTALNLTLGPVELTPPASGSRYATLRAILTFSYRLDLEA
jgi:hypothetical protein